MATGVRTLITINKEVERKLGNVAKERMLEAVNELRNETIRTLSQKGGGRIYTHYFFTDNQGRLRIGKKRWKPHQASAEGKPPARDTSQLVQSIKGWVDGGIGKVGTDQDVGIMLQYGTKNMEARPWLNVAADNARDKIKAIFSRRWI